MAKKNYSGVREQVRRGKRSLVIDFRYTDTTGKDARYRALAKVQTREAAAAEALDLMARAAKTGNPLPPNEQKVEAAKSKGLTLTEFWSDDFAKLYMPQYRPATRVRYEALWKQRVEAFGGARELRSFTSTTYREFASTIAKEGIKPKGAVNVLRTMLKAAYETGRISEQPSFPRGLIRNERKEPNPPSAEEIDHMLTGEGWIVTAILLAADAGLRSGEVRALEVRDISIAKHEITVRHAMSEGEKSTPKSGHERVVPLTSRLEQHLKEVIKDRLPRASVVVERNGASPTRQRLLSAFLAHLRKVDVTERSFHSLRHAFVSRLLRQGANAEAVRQLAGHSSLAMTQRYSHATAQDLRDAIKGLG